MERLHLFLPSILLLLIILVCSVGLSCLVLKYLKFFLKSDEENNFKYYFLYGFIFLASLISSTVYLLLWGTIPLVAFSSMTETNAWPALVILGIILGLIKAFLGPKGERSQEVKSLKFTEGFLLSISLGYLCIYFQSIWISFYIYTIYITTVASFKMMQKDKENEFFEKIVHQTGRHFSL